MNGKAKLPQSPWPASSAAVFPSVFKSNQLLPFGKSLSLRKAKKTGGFTISTNSCLGGETSATATRATAITAEAAKERVSKSLRAVPKDFLSAAAFDVDRINLVERQMDDKADKDEKTGQPRQRGRLP